jgi:hypothetical protein
LFLQLKVSLETEAQKFDGNWPKNPPGNNSQEIAQTPAFFVQGVLRLEFKVFGA